VKPIPINKARDIAETYGYDIVIIVGWKSDGREHLTTYGRTKQWCDWAAAGAKRFKEVFWSKKDG
jgi:hypothetical protein